MQNNITAISTCIQSGGHGPGGNPTQAQRVACAMQVSPRSDEKEAGLGVETLELKSGEKIKVLNGACMAEIKDNLPVLSGKVKGKKVEVLRDTGCSEVIIKRKLVDETDFTGEMGHIMTVYRTIKRAPMAKVEVDTPFYVGTVEALCSQDTLFDLIIRNVPGARRSDGPNPEWGVLTAVATRVQVRNDKDPKPLKMKEETDEISINKKDLIKMQEEDPTLKPSLYSPYYAETCNELRGPSPRLSAWATQLRRNVATVASRWRHCANLTGPGIDPQISRTDSARLATELTAGPLQKLKQLKGTETRKGYVVSYEKRGAIWYRIRQRKDDVGDPRKQILVPKSLRERVMGVAHDSFGGTLGGEEDGGSNSDQFLLARFALGCYQFLSVLGCLPEDCRQRLSATGTFRGHAID